MAARIGERDYNRREREEALATSIVDYHIPQPHRKFPISCYKALSFSIECRPQYLRQTEREEVSLVPVFRHRMCRGLWAEIPTFTVLHGERVTAARQLVHLPRSNWCTSIDIKIWSKMYFPAESVNSFQSMSRCLNHQVLFILKWDSTSVVSTSDNVKLQLSHFSLRVIIPPSLHPPDVVSYVFPLSVFFFCLYVPCCDCCVSSKKLPIEETPLGYVSRFAMISLFFASG